jgi:hypothetical protein
MSDKSLEDVKLRLPGWVRWLSSRLATQGRRLLFVVVYVWVFLALFALHKHILLPHHTLLYGQALALVNAFVIGKVMFFAEELHVGDNFRERPLIYPVLFRSLLFAIILTSFYILEEIGSGLLHGESAAQSVSDIAGGTLAGILSLGIIVFVALIPFFAFREISNVVGSAVIRDLLFVRRMRLVPLSPSVERAARQLNEE